MRHLQAFLFALLASLGAAQAQDYPSRPVTIVVPFAAGGPTDTVARLVAEPMSRSLGQQIVIENVGGAGGTLGAGRVARADPDGYTLLLHHIGQATSASLYRKLAYDPATAFAPVGLVTDVPMTLIGRQDLEPGDVGALLAWVRENGEDVTYGNAGVGSASHLCGMLLMSRLGVSVTTVPYKGTGPAMTDLLGGQFDLMCDQTTNTTGQIQAGRVKAYAVTTANPVSALPDLPTLASAGLDGFEVAVWHGLYAPAGTPEPVVGRLTEALQTALKDEKVIARFADLGTEPVAIERATPEALGSHLDAEIAKWRPVIESAGVFAD